MGGDFPLVSHGARARFYSVMAADEYVPARLRCRPPGNLAIMYGIGIEDESGDFGMIAGPVPTEQELLDEVPGDDRACLLRLDGKEDVVLWRWRGDRWKRE